MLRSSAVGELQKISYVITYDFASDQQDGLFAKGLTNGHVLVPVQSVSRKCDRLVFKRIFINDVGANGNVDWYMLRIQDVFGCISKDGKASDRVMAITREDTLSTWYIYL